MELIADSLLQINQVRTFVGCFILLFFLRKNQKNVLIAFSLLLMTMVYNTYLKSIWKAPLPATIAHVKTWAFPSGHMHASFVFWGWLALTSARKNLWVPLVLLAHVGVSWALVYKGYHFPVDISAAVFFASLSLLILSTFQKFFPKFSTKKVIWMIYGISCFFLYLSYDIIGVSIDHIWLANGALLGIALGFSLSESKLPEKLSLKLLIWPLFALLGAGSVFYLISFLSFPNVATHHMALYTLLSWWIVCGSFLITPKLFIKSPS